MAADSDYDFERFEPSSHGQTQTEPKLSIYKNGKGRFLKRAREEVLDLPETVGVEVDRENGGLAFVRGADPDEYYTLSIAADGKIHTRSVLEDDVAGFGIDRDKFDSVYQLPVETRGDRIIVDVSDLPGIEPDGAADAPDADVDEGVGGQVGGVDHSVYGDGPEITAQKVTEALAGAQTVDQVQRDLKLGRRETKHLLESLGVFGRIHRRVTDADDVLDEAEAAEIVREAIDA